MTREREVEAVEQWFRRRGLPAVVRGRPAHLPVRIVPAVVFIAVWELLTTAVSVVDGETDADFDRLMESDLFAWGYGGLLLGLAVGPALGAWLAARWGRRKVLEHRGAAQAAVAAGLFVVVVPVVDWVVSGDPVVFGIVTHLGILVLLLGAAFVGGGSILGWALRAGLRQTRLLGELTSRALPLLLLFTVFGFFTTEIWQVGASLTRQQMWLVVGLFSAVAIAFLLSMLKDEVATLIQSQAAPVGLDKLRDTPLRPFAAEYAAAPGERVPLTKLERANMVLVLVLTQALQTLVLATLVFVFFVVFGIIAIRHSVIKAWIGRDPTGGSLFGIQVPVTHELLQVSLFVAAFAGLYFAAATVTDDKYRRAFFDPLTDHLTVSLFARDIYLARRKPGLSRS
jgi:MFS family permease